MAAFVVSEQERSVKELSSARGFWTRRELLAGRRSRYLEVQQVCARYYRSSLTFAPRGFSSKSRETGIHRPPAFSTFTSARGENLNAAIVNFSLGGPNRAPCREQQQPPPPSRASKPGPDSGRPSFCETCPRNL